jgi:hypothetical protein
MLYKRILPFIIAFLTLPALINAQITTSSLTGTVKNSDGEDLIGATISAIHQPTGTRYTTASRTGGIYNIPNMRSGGPYTIQVTYVGHKSETYSDITLALAEATIINSVLQKTSSAMEGVVITTAGRNNILNSNRTGPVTNVGVAVISRLPTVNRNLNDILRASPQSNVTSNGFTAGGGNYRSNNFTVDGSDFNNTFGIGSNLPAGGAPISMDAVEEMSISIAPFDVRQSGFIGSAINAVTRSGTNNYSGSVYHFWRGDKQQGNKVGKQTFVKQSLDFGQWGARVGGPIIKNKLFFFLNYETETETSPGQTRIASDPTHPFTGSGNVARPTRAELDDISAYLKTKYDYDTGPYDNYSLERTNKKWLARLDWNISSKHRFNVRYSQVESRTPQNISTSTGGLGTVTGTGTRTAIDALYFKNSIYYQDANFYSLAGELNSTFSNKVSNTFRASYTHQQDPRSSDSKVFPLVDILKNNILFTSFGYEPFTLGNLRDVTMYSYVDNLVFSANKHKFTFGAQLDQSKTLNGFQPFGQSYYRFASFDDFKNGVKPVDFGLTFSLKPDYSQAFPTFKFMQISAYAQDEMSVTKKLKLTFGLRADRTSYPQVDELKTNPLLLGLTFANGEKINTGKLPDPKILISPRIGFNWDIMGDRSLQIRGGTGIFTGKIPFVWIVGQSGNSGMLQVTQAFNGAANTPGVFNPNIGAYRPATVPPAGTVIPTGPTAFSPYFKNPQTWKSSLGFDKKLGSGLIFTLEALLNKDINPIFSKNVNLVNPVPLNIVGVADNRLFYPNATADKYINKLNSTGQPATTGNLQQLNPIVTANGKGGYYFSVTAKIDKQFSKNLFASIAYTGSMADNLYDGQGDQPSNTWSLINTVNGSNFPKLAKADYIVPNMIKIFLSYKREYLKHLATGISLAYSGGADGRFSYIYSNDFNRDGVSGDLIYIPTDATDVNQIVFTNKTVNGVLYDAATQGRMFNDYINQDKYLSKHRGEYAERNGATFPWRHRVDFRFTQDLFANVVGKRNTLQFTVDILNLANLINKDWGKILVTNASNILVPQNVSSIVPGGTTKPTFQLQTVGTGLATTTYRDLLSVGATYSMQFGLRYIFN